MSISWVKAEDVDLTTLPGLNDETANHIASVARSMVEPGDKGSITIKIDLTRAKEKDSNAYNIAYSVTPTHPKRAHLINAHADLAGNLKVHNLEAHQMNLIGKEPDLEKVKAAEAARAAEQAEKQILQMAAVGDGPN